MDNNRGISAGELLLSRFKGRVLKLCVSLGIAMSALALLPAMVSTDDRGRRVAAVAFLLVWWVVAERYRKRSSWVPDVLADRRWVLAAAAFMALPYAIDGHAQSDAFMGVAPLAGVAAAACRRREVIAFAAISIAAYVVGAIIGGGGIEVFSDAEHPFDALQQIAAIGACCGLFAFAVLGFRRFIEQIPSVVAMAGEQPAEAVSPCGSDAAAEAGVAANAGAVAQEDIHDGGRVEQSPKLTNREREVVELLAQGKTRQEIAESLVISRETVKSHFDNVKAKLGVSRQEEAVAVYLESYYGDD